MLMQTIIRCFVTYANGQWHCQFSECALATAGRSRSGSDVCQTNSTCQHIREAHKSQCSKEQATCISLCSSVLTNAPFPPAVRAEFEAVLIGHNPVIQRVSKKSFVVATTPTSESPLGLLHVRVGPNNIIQCTCHKYKRTTSLAGATTAPKLSKRCTHFYLFLWAALSDDSLKQEFSLCDNGK